ncbi:hypothetical protein F4560_002989 [Saccharothrix ecbatanensis]|uniref:Dehydratase n=1 Tax=Saccharothrix ecbatanensis TaxID=1105145 RepID=A0A7W9HJI0_9PSEU|nr:hypothetical protein [Saccharothrix ecbatanensis]MBB5803221.1 hypothetical protein [Saccharothrix ecbatanensis]
MKRFTTLLSTTLALTVLGALVAPSSASASTADVVFSCTESGSAVVPLTYSVSFTAPTKVRRGTMIKLTVSATKPAPADVPAGGIDGDMEIVLGGTASGSITATGLANATAVPIGQPMVLGPGTASLFAGTAGVITYSPGDFVMDIWIGAVLECSLPSGGPVLASTVVY